MFGQLRGLIQIDEVIFHALKAFKDMRNRMHKPMTEFAFDLLCQKLEKLAPGNPDEQVAILMQSIENGWTGLYALRRDSDRSRDRARRNNTLLNYAETGVSHADLKDIEMDMEEL